jgi:hypothetical protein
MLNYNLSNKTFSLAKKINDNNIKISTLNYLINSNNKIAYFNDYILKTLLLTIYEKYSFNDIPVHIFIFTKNKEIKKQYFKLIKILKNKKINGISLYLNKYIKTYNKNDILIYSQDYDISFLNINYFLNSYQINFYTLNPIIPFTNIHSNYYVLEENIYNKMQFIEKIYNNNNIYKAIIYVNSLMKANIISRYFENMNHSCLIIDKNNLNLIDESMNSRLFIIWDNNIINIYSSHVNYMFYIDIPIFNDIYLHRYKYIINHCVIISFINLYKLEYLKDLNKYGSFFTRLFYF